MSCRADGTRTRKIFAVKGRCPSQLDDGTLLYFKLGCQESDPSLQSQNLTYYRCTTPQDLSRRRDSNPCLSLERATS